MTYFHIVVRTVSSPFCCHILVPSCLEQEREVCIWISWVADALCALVLVCGRDCGGRLGGRAHMETSIPLATSILGASQVENSATCSKYKKGSEIYDRRFYANEKKMLRSCRCEVTGGSTEAGG